jgi:hypothetical protein
VDATAVDVLSVSNEPTGLLRTPPDSSADASEAAPQSAITKTSFRSQDIAASPLPPRGNRSSRGRSLPQSSGRGPSDRKRDEGVASAPPSGPALCHDCGRSRVRGSRSALYTQRHESRRHHRWARSRDSPRAGRCACLLGERYRAVADRAAEMNVDQSHAVANPGACPSRRSVAGFGWRQLSERAPASAPHRRWRRWIIDRSLEDEPCLLRRCSICWPSPVPGGRCLRITLVASRGTRAVRILPLRRLWMRSSRSCTKPATARTGSASAG